MFAPLWKLCIAPGGMGPFGGGPSSLRAQRLFSCFPPNSLGADTEVEER